LFGRPVVSGELPVPASSAKSLVFGDMRKADVVRRVRLLEYVAGNPDVSTRLRMLADAQERYRQVAAFSAVTVWEARQFEAGVRRLDEDGEPLTLIVL
jgi:hypothetical protein